MMIMNDSDFDRLNSLSEKSLNEALNQNELKEFKQLMDDWNKSTEFNLLHGLYNQKTL